MSEAADYDGAWKEALDLYLQPFLELCFPQVAAGIDWTVSVEFLDKELQEIVRDSELGKQWVDKLIKVRRLDGAEEWVLLHVEIQAQVDEGLPQRIYEYHHRIRDRYRRRVVTLVVLADPRPGWRPGPYEEELWGCRLRFEYPMCKLLELGRDQEALEQSDNPAARVVAAHLAAQATSGDMELRKVLKTQLARGLYDRGYSEKDILELLRLIDWLLVLPEGLDIAFRAELRTFEQEKTMSHITSFERLSRQEGLQQGLEQGRQEGILDLLRERFGDVPVPVVERVKTLHEEAVLRRLLREAAFLPSLEAFVAQLPN